MAEFKIRRNQNPPARLGKRGQQIKYDTIYHLIENMTIDEWSSVEPLSKSQVDSLKTIVSRKAINGEWGAGVYVKINLQRLDQNWFRIWIHKERAE